MHLNFLWRVIWVCFNIKILGLENSVSSLDSDFVDYEELFEVSRELTRYHGLSDPPIASGVLELSF